MCSLKVGIVNIKIKNMKYEIKLTSCGSETTEDVLNEIVTFETCMIGEGLVWSPATGRDSRLVFKVKGEKHQSSKTKTLAPVDIERVNNIKELVNNLVTESRLEQGLEQLRMDKLEITRKNIGTFLKWIVSDIVKEELDTIMGNGFEPKEIQGQISKVAREWFFKKEMENVN